VQTLLVRHSTNGAGDRQAMDGLAKLSAREGFDGDVHLAVDRSTAHAVVHGANDLGASLVVVETDLDADDGPLGMQNWEEAVASTIAVPLVLVSAGGTEIRRVVLGRVESDEVDDSAAAFVAKLAGAISRGAVLERSDASWDWVSTLQPGDVAFVAVASFELMMGLPTPPPGAALVAVPVTTLARWHPT